MEIVKKEVILINLLKIIINLNKYYSNNNFFYTIFKKLFLYLPPIKLPIFCIRLLLR